MAKTSPASSAARYILVATALLLPTLSLVPLGGLYLWQNGYVLWWALAALVSVVLVVAMQRWLIAGAVRKSPVKDGDPAALSEGHDAGLADPTWSPAEAQAWADVKVVASRVDLEKMVDLDSVILLGRNTVDVVARRLHPTRHDAIWQFTLPEALAISERVSRRLGRMIETKVPFGDRMTVSQFIAIYQWRHMLDTAERVYDIWRLVRLVNPATALTNEARERLSRALFQWGREHVMRRLVETYVEEVGRAAIDLYGGRLKITRAQIGDAMDAPEAAGDLAALTRAPVIALVAGGSEAARENAAALLRMVEQDQARAMVERLGTKDAPTAVSDLVGMEVRLSRADITAAKQVRRLVEEAGETDLLVWAVANDKTPLAAHRSAIAAIADHFKAAPNLLAPAIVPLRLASAAAPGTSSREEIGKALSGAGMAVVDPVDADPASANPEQDGVRLAAALERALPHARRVKAVRFLERLKAQRNLTGAGRQAASAIGSAIRSIFRR
jgi:uncharacterized protein